MDSYKLRIQQSLSLIHGAINEIMGLQKGKKNELSMISMSILYTSYIKKIRMKDISEIYDISKSTASGYVDNLEKKGFIKRVKGKDDKRNIYVEPTENGKIWISEHEKKLSDYIEEHMSNLTLEEQEKFVELLSKFVNFKES